MELEEVYEKLESHSENNFWHDVTGDFLKVRDEKKENGFEEIAQIAQWEIEFFSFRIIKNELHSMWKSGDHEFPALKTFTDQTYDYLVTRLNSSKNPPVKARYAHILWLSPRRNFDYAKTAVDSYLASIILLEKLDQAEPDKHHGLHLVDTLLNAFRISISTKYKADVLKTEVLRLINEFYINSSSSFYLRFELTNLIIDQAKVFKDSDFLNITGVLTSVADVELKKDHWPSAIKLFELAERVDLKIKKDSTGWKRRMAEVYEKQMETRNDEDSVALTFCSHALELYKQINDRTKVSELELKFNQLKQSFQLGSVSHDIDISDVMEHAKSESNRLKALNNDDVFKYLISNKNLLPRYEDLADQAEKSKNEFPLQYLMPKTIYDKWGHPIQHFGNDEERMQFAILQGFDLSLQAAHLHFLHYIMIDLIRHRKISYESFCSFLDRDSWLTKEITRKTRKGNSYSYRWLDILSPGVQSYFTEIYFWLLDDDRKPNFVLVVDSLALKIEGLLRDICEFSGITAFISQNDGQGRITYRQKDINTLLREEKLLALIGQNDSFFLRFLLVEHVGYNLRNQVAHAFFGPDEYTVTAAHLLIIAILKLSRFQVIAKEPAET
ncbi:DUF4209 domain-containing protein [bacterium]|nr:MAG: DUF4209 domain-containing protein [bacterium]